MLIALAVGRQSGVQDNQDDAGKACMESRKSIHLGAYVICTLRCASAGAGCKRSHLLKTQQAFGFIHECMLARCAQPSRKYALGWDSASGWYHLQIPLHGLSH